MDTSKQSSSKIICSHAMGQPTRSPPNILSAPPPPPSSQTTLIHHPAPAPAPGGLVYGEGGGPSAWWTPIQAKTEVSIGITKAKRMGRPTSNSGQANGIGTPNGHSESKENAANSIEIVPMSNRPRLRKVDDSGKLVWPFELEAVLIAGLRKYHATTCRPRPSASRNVNRNKLVSEYIYDMTGLRRSTKQIASRIQVLRDAWKGSKQFALVAQPRELSEMGYLPSAEEFDEMADISMQGPNGPLLPPSFTEAPSTEGQGPMRNRRSTRRSNRMTNKGQEQITPTAAENMHSAALVTQPQGAPPDRASGTMYAQMPSPIEHRTQSMYGEHTHSSSHPRDAVSIQECTTPVPGVQPTFTPQLVSAKLSPHISGTFLSFDLHQLDQIPSLSRPSLTLTVPALQLLESRKKRLQGMRNIVAQCSLPLSFLKRRGSLPPQDSHAAASLSIPQLTMEICSFRLHEQVQSLGENEPQRQLLGTKFTVLHNSVVYTTEEKILARDAGVIEKESINNHDSTAKTRYPLPTQFINRQMFEETHRPILVVQTLSVLRATDSRLLDSLAVLWVFDRLSSRSDETPNLQLFHFDLSRRNTSFSSFASSSSEASTMALQRPNPFVGVHIVRDVQSYSPLSSYSSIVTDEEPMDGVSSHDQGSRPSGPGARSIPGEGQVEPLTGAPQVHPNEATTSPAAEASWLRSSPSPIFSPQDRSIVDVASFAVPRPDSTNTPSPIEMSQRSGGGQQYPLAPSGVRSTRDNIETQSATPSPPYCREEVTSAPAASYHHLERGVPPPTNQESFAWGSLSAGKYQYYAPTVHTEDSKYAYVAQHPHDGSWVATESYPQYGYQPYPYLVPVADPYGQYHPQPMPCYVVGSNYPSNVQDGQVGYQYAADYNPHTFYTRNDAHLARIRHSGNGDDPRDASNCGQQRQCPPQIDTSGGENADVESSWVSNSPSDTSSASPLSYGGRSSFVEHILHPDAISPPAPSPLSYKGEPPLTLLAPNDPAGYAYSTYGVPLDRFLIEYPPPIQSLVEQQRQLYYTSPAPGAPNSADPAVYNIHH